MGILPPRNPCDFLKRRAEEPSQFLASLKSVANVILLCYESLQVPVPQELLE